MMNHVGVIFVDIATIIEWVVADQLVQEGPHPDLQLSAGPRLCRARCTDSVNIHAGLSIAIRIETRVSQAYLGELGAISDRPDRVEVYAKGKT